MASQPELPECLTAYGTIGCFGVLLHETYVCVYVAYTLQELPALVASGPMRELGSTGKALVSMGVGGNTPWLTPGDLSGTPSCSLGLPAGPTPKGAFEWMHKAHPSRLLEHE